MNMIDNKVQPEVLSQIEHTAKRYRELRERQNAGHKLAAVQQQIADLTQALAEATTQLKRYEELIHQLQAKIDSNPANTILNILQAERAVDVNPPTTVSNGNGLAAEHQNGCLNGPPALPTPANPPDLPTEDAA
jgi:septal ring factor EnvC (AmiA/AmiB activator)